MAGSIPELIAKTDEQLSKQNRSDRDLRKFHSTWKSLRNYAQWYCIESISWELLCCYWRECWGLTLLDDYWDDRKSIPLFESKIRPLLFLLLCQKGGNILRMQKLDLWDSLDCFSDIVSRYSEFCRIRNLKPSTLQGKIWAIKPFLLSLKDQGVCDAAQISRAQVSDYTKTLTSRSLNSARMYFGNLREFLRFLYDEHLTAENLSVCVPKISGRKRRLAQVWTKDEIDRLLNAIERGTAVGKRDYAVFMLASHLGLRTGDICNLKFENIRWAECIVSFTQEKTGNRLDLPFNEDVGSAIIDYLKNGRPRGDTSPFVFVRHTPPFGKVKNFWYPMQRYLQEANIKVSLEKPHGLHTLRFALATRMLDEEISLETISAVLGHESSAATQRYLRADINKLRECALNPDEVFQDA